MLNEKDLKRFESKFIPEPNSGCWIWTGHTNGQYGRFSTCRNNKETSHYAHRVALMHYKGEKLGRWDYACHKCHNTYCVNPNHLYKGTPQSNMDDRSRIGNGNEGIKHPMAKLDENDVHLIRQAISMGVRQKDIAAAAGVDKTTIRNIKNRKTWRHLK